MGSRRSLLLGQGVLALRFLLEANEQYVVVLLLRLPVVLRLLVAMARLAVVLLLLKILAFDAWVCHGVKVLVIVDEVRAQREVVVRLWVSFVITVAQSNMTGRLAAQLVTAKISHPLQRVVLALDPVVGPLQCRLRSLHTRSGLALLSSEHHLLEILNVRVHHRRVRHPYSWAELRQVATLQLTLLESARTATLAVVSAWEVLHVLLLLVELAPVVPLEVVALAIVAVV